MNEMLRVQQLGRQEYTHTWQQLRSFTDNRTTQTIDEIWLLEHDPVYTQGQAGKAEHLLNPKNIPVVQTDRGGQITYHGPGQLIVYTLIDIKNKSLNIREFISHLEQSVMELLASYNITATTIANAPGIYVGKAKIGSIGLRLRRGCTYHGLSLNVAMDLEPFSRINPCGYKDMQMVQISDLGGPQCINTVSKQLISILSTKLGYKEIIYG